MKEPKTEFSAALDEFLNNIDQREYVVTVLHQFVSFAKGHVPDSAERAVEQLKQNISQNLALDDSYLYRLASLMESFNRPTAECRFEGFDTREISNFKDNETSHSAGQPQVIPLAQMKAISTYVSGRQCVKNMGKQTGDMLKSVFHELLNSLKLTSLLVKDAREVREGIEDERARRGGEYLRPAPQRCHT